MFTKEMFGERLKELRKNNGEKQDDLAEVLGVRKSHVCEMEHGNRTTTLEKLALLCEHYNVSADYLLGLKDQP